MAGEYVSFGELPRRAGKLAWYWRALLRWAFRQQVRYLFGPQPDGSPSRAPPADTPGTIVGDVDDAAPMEQPVQESGGHNLIAEDPAPFLGALVRRRFRRGAPVAPVDGLEEEAHTALRDRLASDLLNDQRYQGVCIWRWRLSRPPWPPPQRPQVGQGSEVDPAPVLGRRDCQADRQLRVADPGRAQEDDVPRRSTNSSPYRESICSRCAEARMLKSKLSSLLTTGRRIERTAASRHRLLHSPI